MESSMRALAVTLIDVAVGICSFLIGPVVKVIAKLRPQLPRFQSTSDRFGFQLRTTHYYEPTYRAADLQEAPVVERNLPAIDLNIALQLELLERCRFTGELQEIPIDVPRLGRFGFQNGNYSFGDAEMLYNIIRLIRPSRIVEIGSGMSTLIARLAIDVNAQEGFQPPDHVCIEPYEAPWLESAGVTVRRERVEDAELALFEHLGTDDILFIDSSHVIRPNGDVLREYLEILPRIAPGVWIHVHDVFTPRDYPATWVREERRLWNEQYLLEAFLSHNSDFEVVCALNWLHHNHRAELAAACPMLGAHPLAEPGAFWIRRR